MARESHKRYTLGKAEKLKSRKAIAGLFAKGDSIHSYPVRAIYRRVEDLSDDKINCRSQVAFVAGKRRYRRAVDRNRIKRLMRESYRLNKHILLDAAEHSEIAVHLMMVYTGKKILSQKEITSSTIAVLQRLSKKLASA